MPKLLLVIAILTGCLHEASENCGNGNVCPPGQFCVDTEHTTAADRICSPSACGNGVVDPGEACDDGNNRSGDGCPADCAPPCGDGVLDPGEVCDDGNNTAGDGCASDCQSRAGELQSSLGYGFVIREGDPVPPDGAILVANGHPDDRLEIGTVPDWLSITLVPSSFLLTLHVHDVSVIGLRTTVVPLTLGHIDGTHDFFDLRVSYLIEPTELSVQAAPDTLVFTAMHGDPVPPAQLTTLTSAAVSVISAPDWLTVYGEPVSATFTVWINSTYLPAGTLSGDIVFGTSYGTLQSTTSVHVDYTVIAANPLTITPDSTSVMLDTYVGGTSSSRTIDVAFSGDLVELVAAPEWLAVTGPTDATHSPARFTIKAKRTLSAATGAPQNRTGHLELRTTHGSNYRDVGISVYENEYAMPELGFVSPYVGYAGRPGTLLVNGHGFQGIIPLVIAIGDVHVQVRQLSDGQVSIAYPALAPGRYPITLIDPPGSAPFSPELVVVAPPVFNYQAFAGAGNGSQLIYDAERQALYRLNPAAQQIEHFAYRDGSWTARSPHPAPGVISVSEAPDGRSLVAIERSAIDAMSLADGAFSLVPRVSVLNDCHLDGANIAGNGKVFVSEDISADCPAYTYDLRDRSFTAEANFEVPLSAASGDGNYVYVAGVDRFNQPNLAVYTATSDRTDVWRRSISSLSISRDGSLLLVDHDGVFNDDLMYPRGFIPANENAVISQDGSRAFLYVQDDRAHLDVYDLTSWPNLGMYPLLYSRSLPDLASAADGDAVVLVVTPDGSTVFVSGTAHLLIVPVL